MGVIVVLYVELGLVLHCTDEYLGTNRCRSVVKKTNNNFYLLLFPSLQRRDTKQI